MYGGSRAPSLMPKYATYYVVHKEVVRQLFIDGVGNFLFDMKKTAFPPLPFCIGSYKFTRVKSAFEFVKDLENLHFPKKSFHINDSMDKVADHCVLVGVLYEYSHYFDKDEETYMNAVNMTALRKHFKKTISTNGGKGSSNTTKK